jgi:DNA mismatch endonuclease (patch repair protein)
MPLKPKPTSPDAEKRMKNQRQGDTRPEMALRKILFRKGYRYRVNRAPLPGLKCRADLVFPSKKVAVFVDGCFWHVCPEHGTWPKNNAAWWKEKLEANQRRDKKVNAMLTDHGWLPFRIWEHENPETAAAKVGEILKNR